MEVSEAHAELQVKSGSGDISVGTCLGSVNVSTGSGDVEVGTTNGPTVVKTGSGDLKVVTANDDISLSTGSGDLTVGTARRGRVSAEGRQQRRRRSASPAGTPVWADINTVTGSIRSNIESVGAPQEGQDHVELQARTVSGDIVLTARSEPPPSSTAHTRPPRRRTAMNETVIEAQARYLIEDRIHPTHQSQPTERTPPPPPAAEAQLAVRADN